MTSIPSLDHLRDRSRHETCPSVQVSDQIMTLLRANESSSVLLLQRPMAWCAGLASTAAVVAVIMALIQHWAGGYPLQEMAYSILWVIQ